MPSTTKAIQFSLSLRPWEQLEVDAFVVPTNSECRMSDFPASRIRELAGQT